MALYDTQVLDSYSTTAPFWDTPKDNDAGESQWVNFGQLVVHFAWKEKEPYLRLYTSSWAVAISLTRWSGASKEYDWATIFHCGFDLHFSDK